MTFDELLRTSGIFSTSLKLIKIHRWYTTTDNASIVLQLVAIISGEQSVRDQMIWCIDDD